MSRFFDTFEIRHLMLCSLPSLAGILAYVLLWIFPEQSLYLKLLTVLILGVVTIYFSYHSFQGLNNKVNVICNLLEAVQQENFSLRGSTKGHNIFSNVISQINTITAQLSRHRQEQREMNFLLHKILSNITISIFALDSHNRVIWCNHAATQMLDCPEESLIGEDCRRWKLDWLLKNADSGHPVSFSYKGRPGRYKISSDSFIVDGESNALLFVSDVDALLRREEKKTWQNLLRVISHEINNSLSPIASICQMLQKHYCTNKDPGDDGIAQGVDLIYRRAKELIAFISSYQQLNKLAAPHKTEVDIASLIKEVPLLFMHRKFELHGASHLLARVDRGQIHQLLINVVKNADEAMGERRDPIEISWHEAHSQVILSIKDRGSGVSNPDNLFVPFYTTKSSGSGIGLILCRQIAEQHGGYFTLQNRQDTPGCNAMIHLPC